MTRERREIDHGMPDPDAESEFVRHWTQAQPVVAAYIGALLRDRHQADDVLQQVAVVAWRKMAEYDRAQPFSGWAMGIARHEVLHHRRSLKRSIICFHSDLLEAVGAEYAAAAAELGERADAMRACLKGLPESGWTLLRLRYEDALSPAAIAARLGRTANQVRVALHRLRAGLETCINRRLASRR